MAKQSITVELDDDTIRCLAVLGAPIDVLAQLAYAAADGVRRPDRERREQTDKSLRIERDRTDAAIAQERETVEGAADDVVEVARQRADEVLQTARHDADRESRPPSMATAPSERERARADNVLKNERSSADAALLSERAERRRYPDELLARERASTNTDLTGERAHADTLLVDQRESNERMVSATIRAQELRDEADSAKQRAEQSETDLRAVAEFREMFIGILGHDLRNPLGSITMASALLLRRGHLDVQDAETVARIIRASQRITKMVAQLLDLTRARLGGGFPIERAPMDLGEVCGNVVQEFDASIHLDTTGDLTGTWDNDRLAEALSNLTGNAVEYAAPGTEVRVSARGEGESAVVEITNHGQAIPADILPFIFEPFRRARQQEKSRAGNLGLGLYIAHEIVVSHGGTLEARSADGVTTFVMRLPRRVT